MEQEILNLILIEIREMKGDMKEVKDRLTNLENDMTEVKSRLINVENRLTNVEELAEFNKETCESIMRVTTEQYNEFKNLAIKNKEEHIMYNSKILTYRVEEDKE